MTGNILFFFFKVKFYFIYLFFNFYFYFILLYNTVLVLFGSSCTPVADSCQCRQHSFVDSLVQFSRSVVSDSLWPHESQHARPPCPSPTPGVHSDSRPSSQWCHPAISSSVIPFSSCPQFFPASGSFPMSQLFAWGGQSTGVSALASVPPMNTQDWSPLEWSGWISHFFVGFQNHCRWWLQPWN